MPTLKTISQLLAIILGFFLLDHFLPTVAEEKPPVYSETTGMRLARDGESVKDSTSITLSTARVTLPTGYKFMYIIPAEEARKINPFWKLQNVYVVRLTIGDRRLIEFLQAGKSPGLWEVILIIDER